MHTTIVLPFFWLQKVKVKLFYGPIKVNRTQANPSDYIPNVYIDWPLPSPSLSYDLAI